MNFFKDKTGNYITTLWMLKMMIVFIFFAIEIFAFYFHVNELKRDTVTAMECALKIIYVNDSNEICVDQIPAMSTFNEYLQLNLKLNGDFTPKVDNKFLADAIVINELSVYDPVTTGLPVMVDGHTFSYPSMKIAYTAHIKPMFASLFNLPTSIPYNVIVYESNEPPN